MEQRLTAGQAQWIVERLLAERRISATDVRRYLGDMSREIADLERRLTQLREISGTGSRSDHRAATVTQPVPKPRKARVRRQSAAVRPRGIAGTLAVLLRAIPAAEHAAIQAIRTKQGIQAAIKAARAAAKK